MTVLVGDDTQTGTSTYGNTAPSVWGTDFTATASGPCTNGYAYYSGTVSRQLYLVVYDAAENLIAQSTVTTTGTVAGWLTFTFSPPLTIVEGTQYWLGVYAENTQAVGIGGTTSPGSMQYYNGGTWPTAPSVFAHQGTVVSNNISAYLELNATLPVVTTVNGSNPIAEGATGIQLVGSNFSSGMTIAITQPNGVSVEQANVTVTSSTAATFDVVMEPSQGDKLAYSDSTYVTDIVVSAGGQSSAPVAVTLTPSNGQPFQTLGILNVNTPVRVEAIPDFVPGDQLEFAGDSSGTTPPPAGTVPHADGSFEATADFYARAYIQADAAWTPWTLITVSPAQPGQGFFGGGGV